MARRRTVRRLKRRGPTFSGRAALVGGDVAKGGARHRRAMAYAVRPARRADQSIMPEPKISVWIRAGSTPRAASAAVCSRMNATGPHT